MYVCFAYVVMKLAIKLVLSKHRVIGDSGSLQKQQWPPTAADEAFLDPGQLSMIVTCEHKGGAGMYHVPLAAWGLCTSSGCFMGAVPRVAGKAAHKVRHTSMQ
jgi:hypothetical protein